MNKIDNKDYLFLTNNNNFKNKNNLNFKNNNRNLLNINFNETDIDNEDYNYNLADSYSTFIGAGFRYGLYTINILIGNPAQSFKVMLDTGSASLNIPSSECLLQANYNQKTKCSCTNNHEATYNKKLSKNSKIRCLSETCIYKEVFVDKSFLFSQLIEDTVQIGPYSIDTVFGSIIGESLTFAYKECPPSENYQSKIFDGILGLGTQAIDRTLGKDILTKISEKYNISNSFSMCFGSTGIGGQFKIGGYDRDLIVEPMRYIPANRRDTYNLTVSTMHIGEHKLNHSTYGAWIDSGSTSIVLPIPVYNNLINTMYENFPLVGLKEGQLWNPEYPCAVINPGDLIKYPVLNISFLDENGVPFHLSVSPLNYLVFNPKEKCYEFLIRTMEGNFFIIGDLGLLGYNVHFDKENQRVGFARASPNCSTFSENLNLDVAVSEDNIITAKINGGKTIYSLRGITVEFRIRSSVGAFFPTDMTFVKNSTDEHGVAIATLTKNYRSNVVIEVVATEHNNEISNLLIVTIYPKAFRSNVFIPFLALFVFIALLIVIVAIRKVSNDIEVKKQKENLFTYEMLLYGESGASEPALDEDQINKMI